MDHLPFLESDSHADEAGTSNLELANVLVKTSKILKTDVGYMCAEVELGSDIDPTVEGLESGPNVASSGRFVARDNGGDNGGDAALDDVLDLCILLPPFAMGLEGRGSSTNCDDGHRNLRERRERVVGAFDETPETLALQCAHDGFTPSRVISSTVEDGDVVEFERHEWIYA
jgi:hypothetical protein